MQKILFGIFAHPDDEAFGVAPTLLNEVASGTSVHLITLTAGENGANPDNVDDLQKVRLEEWRTAGEMMGASGLHHLGYMDGTLANKDLLEISRRIHDIVEGEAIARPESSIEFMAFDENGLTGHIDHIVATRAGLHAFYTLKQTYGDRISKIRLRCLASSEYPTANTEWVYMNAGRSEAEIDEVVDGTTHHDAVISVMRAHHSQRADAESQIYRLGDKLGMNYFIVKD